MTKTVLDCIGNTPMVALANIGRGLPVPVLETAGNTGLGLALVAALRGYKLVRVLPEKMSVDKRNALRAVAAEVIVTPNAAPSHDDNFHNVARRLASERGWFLTD